MSQRKNDHIQMAASSVPAVALADKRFYYEPLIGASPDEMPPVNFMGKVVRHPLWISSMTGGSPEANRINHMLAEAAAEFGLGMGLGSCRTLLNDDTFFDDFNLRPILGSQLPFFANLGIAQVEQLLQHNAFDKIARLIDKLQADGLIVHVNPVQEFLQPEGDFLQKPAFETIQQLTEQTRGRFKLMVKEVGQGMGPLSLEKLFQLKIDGIEFGAFGGTNFANIEIRRNQQAYAAHLLPLAGFGHTADEMIGFSNHLKNATTNKNIQLIVSGGVQNFLDGYYFLEKSQFPALYGMAGKVLKHALKSRNDLFAFLKAETEGFKFARTFLKVRETVV